MPYRKMELPNLHTNLAQKMTLRTLLPTRMKLDSLIIIKTSISSKQKSIVQSTWLANQCIKLNPLIQIL